MHTPQTAKVGGGTHGFVPENIPGLEASRPMPEVNAWVDPPIGWRIDKLDVDAKHAHVTWLSPTVTRLMEWC